MSFFLDAAGMLGVPKSVAAIYGMCFASPAPLSFADINQRLDISQGSISQGLRVLREIGAIKLSDRPPPSIVGGAVHIHEAKRRDYYTPELELRRVIGHFIEQRLEKHLNAGSAKLKAVKITLPYRGDDSIKELEARLRYLATWHDKARGILPVIKTFLKLT